MRPKHYKNKSYIYEDRWAGGWLWWKALLSEQGHTEEMDSVRADLGFSGSVSGRPLFPPRGRTVWVGVPCPRQWAGRLSLPMSHEAPEEAKSLGGWGVFASRVHE